jgi:prolyl-tRNA editing enzyme YbaK/EbsC (Cys-tRNA(Pro) deacylase)
MEKQMRKKQTNTIKVIKYIQKNPTAKAKEVSQATGVSVSGVYQAVYLQKKKVNGMPMTTLVPKSDWKLASVSTSSKSVYQKPSTLAPNAVASMALHGEDKVNHPSHYKVGGIETIDFIEAKNLGYNLGNVVKYITRADHKGNKLEDLKKAQWYLNRAVSKLSKT